MKKYFWIKFTNSLIVLFIILMIIVLIVLPFLVDKYALLTGTQIQNPIFIKVFLYLTAMPFTILLLEARKLCGNIIRLNPFCKNSITELNIISICAFIDFLLYAVSTFIILKNLLSLTIMVAAFMVGLTSLILSQLVAVAMEIKQENDLTI